MLYHSLQVINIHFLWTARKYMIFMSIVNHLHYTTLEISVPSARLEDFKARSKLSTYHSGAQLGNFERRGAGVFIRKDEIIMASG